MTLSSEKGASLSGGEKQRISIARAMLKDADIIIFDEATANVDPENEDKLKEAIESLTKNKTVIMIAHRLKTIRNADQILVLKDGEIVERGDHEELIKNDGLYSDLINAKAKAETWKLNNWWKERFKVFEHEKYLEQVDKKNHLLFFSFLNQYGNFEDNLEDKNVDVEKVVATPMMIEA